MAKPTKLPSGKWRGQIRKKGYKSLSATFPTKGEARRWIVDAESKLNRGVNVHHEAAAQMSFLEAVELYEAAKMPIAKHPEKLRSQLKTIKQSDLVKYSVANVTVKVVRGWKDERLKSVKAATVIKDVNKVSAIFSWLEGELDIQLPNDNPVKKLIKPTLDSSSERNRVATMDETGRLLDYFKERNNRQMFKLINLALATGMRRGELVSMRYRHINFEDGTLHIPKTKNNTPRDVPLFTGIRQILLYDYKEARRDGDDRVIRLEADSVTQAFSRACKALSIEDLRFHDLRHTALTWMFEEGKLTMAEIATISGHRSYDMLKRYTHIKAKDLTKKINSGG